ncbi:MAG: helix-turn-helix domain-containing protein [Enterococcus sp.]|nr:helix-turn-helix domain-containing protein [Enterococcus sp.]
MNYFVEMYLHFFLNPRILKLALFKGGTFLTNLMFIDDEKTILHGLTNLVDWASHDINIVGAFSNSLEALDFFDHQPVDIVVTDLIMPELDGIELSRLFKKKQPDVQILVLSSHDDFQLVKDSFVGGVSDYLLKPKLNPENLLSAITKLVHKKQKLPSTTESLKQDLANYFSGQTTALSPKKFSYPIFYLVYNEMKELTYLKEKSLTSEWPLEFFPFTTLNRGFGCLINTASTDIYPQLIDYLSETSKTKETLCILSKELDFSELYTEFTLLKKNGKGQLFYHLHKGSLVADQLTPLVPHYETSTKSYLTKIVNKDYLSAIRELSATVETMIVLRIDPLFLKHETMNRLYALIHAMDDEEEKHYELTKLKMTLTAQFADAFAIERFVQVFNNIIQQLMVWVVPEKKENSAILTLIYEYVQRNYHEDLSLQSISEKFHFSYSYLSTIFTEKYGINFTKYLKKVRIQHAKRLLTETTDPLSEICSQVGYTDLGYFSRVFKEETGMSPSHYRKGSMVK